MFPRPDQHHRSLVIGKRVPPILILLSGCQPNLRITRTIYRVACQYSKRRKWEEMGSEADLEDINQLLDRRCGPVARKDADVRIVGVTGGFDHRSRLFA